MPVVAVSRQSPQNRVANRAGVLSHEFRHVQQYGQAGSPAAYLDQFLTVGYRAHTG